MNPVIVTRLAYEKELEIRRAVYAPYSPEPYELGIPPPAQPARKLFEWLFHILDRRPVYDCP